MYASTESTPRPTRKRQTSRLRQGLPGEEINVLSTKDEVWLEEGRIAAAGRGLGPVPRFGAATISLNKFDGIAKRNIPLVVDQFAHRGSRKAVANTQAAGGAS